MPEFILNHGDADGAERFATLDSFTQGYVEALFFTDTGYPENENLEHATFAELAPEALAGIVADCAQFQTTDAYTLAETDIGASFDAEHAGRDFWYTRNGHGSGFWDGDWAEPYAGQLTDAAKSFGEAYVYRGDDGRIYV